MPAKPAFWWEHFVETFNAGGNAGDRTFFAWSNLFAEQSFGGEAFALNNFRQKQTKQTLEPENFLAKRKPEGCSVLAIEEEEWKYQKLKQNKGKNFNDEFSGTEKVVNEL